MIDDLPPADHNLAIFGGITVTEWEPEPLPPKGQMALNNFLGLHPDALIPVARHVFAYYQDMMLQLDGQGWPDVPLPHVVEPEDIWNHVSPTGLFVKSDWDEDGPWYIGIDANIPWEVEHGLCMIWEDGHRLVKVGRIDGHVTNANSYEDPNLEGVVYAAISPQFKTTQAPDP